MFTLRALRHFFISWAINRPVNPLNPLEVQRIVGHTNLEQILKTYYHADMDGVTGKKMRSMSLGDDGAIPESGEQN